MTDRERPGGAPPDPATAPLDPGERATLDAWETAEPPADFADRVVAARQAELAAPAAAPASPSGSRGLLSRAAALVAVAAAAVLVYARVQGAGERRPGEPGGAGAPSGSLVATARQSVQIAGRAVAVVEAGGDLSWSLGAGGAVRVEQRRGSVFYRVEHGAPFVVATAAGDVTVMGTCFSVEVEPMMSKHSLAGAAIGAAIGATVAVGVYEGRVLLANEQGRTEVAAGQRAQARAGEAPGRAGPRDAPTLAADLPSAPREDVTREELLARDRSQREQIGALRGRVKRLEDELGGASAVDPRVMHGLAQSGRSWLEPSHDELVDMAKSCEVRFDLPPLMGPGQGEVDTDLELTESERLIANEELDKMHARFLDDVRKLYVEATGDTEGADRLSADAMVNEISDKSAPGEADRVRARIAQERAGLVAPAADPRAGSPIERYYRLLATVGDDFEHALGARLGDERAHELRSKNGGWGSRMTMSGCTDKEPEEPGTAVREQQEIHQVPDTHPASPR